MPPATRSSALVTSDDWRAVMTGCVGLRAIPKSPPKSQTGLPIRTRCTLAGAPLAAILAGCALWIGCSASLSWSKFRRSHALLCTPRKLRRSSVYALTLPTMQGGCNGKLRPLSCGGEPCCRRPSSRSRPRFSEASLALSCAYYSA